ncbi:hypothetical protein LTR36_001220 [Oleoguttula mirabilis]|uniref:BHLH domain-containing protein n=1 Tax=Oleoguttula mirabilis TaxID=1507867 RepID=A0AAV9JNM3_9PEZI|nr:hypothetical protein LTR36_001220 [Oleoguttula mirabilis]
MDPSASQPWSQSEQQLDPLAHMTDELDDLGSFLDFGEIDLNNISNVDTTEYGEHLQQAQRLSHPNTPFNGGGHAPTSAGIAAQDFGGQEQFGMSQNMDQHQQQYHSQAPTNLPFTSQSMYQPMMGQMYHQSQIPQFQFPAHSGFPPPTPNSFDMHGEAGQFLHQTHQLDSNQLAMLDQQYGLRKNDSTAFTPMVSPAGTPQYNMLPEFTTPGAYFSPLTSPMLHAQVAQNAQQHPHLHGYYTNPSTAPSSNATSPIDPHIDIDMITDGLTLPESAVAQPKRSRRRVTTPRTLAVGARVRQSPIQKPQKRKSGTLSQVMSSREELVNEAQRSGNLQPRSAGLQMSAVFNASSGDESISPEPLSESVMGPPPKPGSRLTQSPAMLAQRQGERAVATEPAATPKSLLSRSANQQPINGSTESAPVGSDPESLEDLQLPEAAANQASARPALAQIDTQVPPVGSNEHTPRVSARKTPKLGPLSTPSSARPSSTLVSPLLMGSPISASTPGVLLKEKRPDAKTDRSNKKRSSVGGNGSNMASPAIRPRISPSIKPLLPDGSALHSPTHALLLASKSNYQNLLEGNHLPGVNYPDSLSTGLTSKRTSHKVAEQGRRNRINDALKEMQLLLPKQATTKGSKDNSNSDDSPDAGPGADGDSKESKEDAAAKSNNSKAATVESANVYIRIMQAEHRQREVELDRLRHENEELASLKRENERLAKQLAEQGATQTCSAEQAVEMVDSASPGCPEA